MRLLFKVLYEKVRYSKKPYLKSYINFYSKKYLIQESYYMKEIVQCLLRKNSLLQVVYE